MTHQKSVLSIQFQNSDLISFQRNHFCSHIIRFQRKVAQHDLFYIAGQGEFPGLLLKISDNENGLRFGFPEISHHVVPFLEIRNEISIDENIGIRRVFPEGGEFLIEAEHFL